jgi:hypothetical protein
MKQWNMQRDMGQYEAKKYFDKEAKINKLKWSQLTFDDGKVDLYDDSAIADGGNIVSLCMDSNSKK